MRSTWNNFLTVCVLAFLQCLAPLLHAHAGGLQAPHDHAHEYAHVHFHTGISLLPHAAQVSELRADSCDLAVVSVASEFKRDSATDHVVGAPPRMVWPSLPEPLRDVAARHPYAFPLLSFHPVPPPSQAPPV